MLGATPDRAASRKAAAAGPANDETAQATKVLGRAGSPVPVLCFSPYGPRSLDSPPPTPETPLPAARLRLGDSASVGSASSTDEDFPADSATAGRPHILPQPAHAQAALPTSQRPRQQRTALQSAEQKASHREWCETRKLLSQRAELLSHDLPAAGGGTLPGARSDPPFVEALREVTAEADALSVSRAAEAQQLSTALRLAKQKTAEFGGLLDPARGPGDDWVLRLKRVVGEAAERLRAARGASELRRAALASDETRLFSELAELASTFSSWDEKPAIACPPTRDAKRGSISVRGGAGGVRQGGSSGRAGVSSANPRAAAVAGGAAAAQEVGGAAAEAEAGGGVAAARGAAAAAAAAIPPEGAAAISTGTDPAECEAASLRAEVEVVEAALDRLGGPSCGWEEGDHAVFLRSRTQIFGTCHAHRAFTAAAAALFTDDGASADRRRAETYAPELGRGHGGGTGFALSPAEARRAVIVPTLTWCEAGDAAGAAKGERLPALADEGRAGGGACVSRLGDGDGGTGLQVGGGTGLQVGGGTGLQVGGETGLQVGGGTGLQMVADAREAALIDRAAALLGVYSKAQIIEHAVRTARREALLTARKHAIARWRHVRQQQREAAAETQAAAAAAAGAAGGAAWPEGAVHTGSALFTGATGGSGGDGSQAGGCGRAAERAARLREWREARVRSAHEEEVRRVEEQARAAAAAEASAKRRQEERRALASVAAQRRAQAQADADAASRLASQVTATARAQRALDLIPLRARDDTIARRRRAARLAQQQEQASRAARIDSLAEQSRPDLGSVAKRDRARLLRPTASAKARIDAVATHGSGLALGAGTGAGDRAAGRPIGGGGRPPPPVAPGSRLAPAWRANLARG